MAKSLEQLKKEAAKLQEQIEFMEASSMKYVQVAEEIKQVVKDRGLELDEVIKYLAVPKVRAPRDGLEKKPPASRDKTGAMPSKGITYHHKSLPEDWTCIGSRTPNAWIELIKMGSTWKQLEAR